MAMISVDEVNRVYEASASLARDGAEILVVADDVGARLDKHVKLLFVALKDEDPEIWSELFIVARRLRWRSATDPSPPEHRDDHELVSWLQQQRNRASALLDRTKFASVDGLISAAEFYAQADRPTGQTLLESLFETADESCSVIVDSARLRESVSTWFSSLDLRVAVHTKATYMKASPHDQAYVVGRPGMFDDCLLTAPRSARLSYVTPSWMTDMSIPRSQFAQAAEISTAISAKCFSVGECVSPPSEDEVQLPDEALEGPMWTAVAPSSRPPKADEVLARKVFLTGGFSIMLDREGESIRMLLPDSPLGNRVSLGPVSSVHEGTFLVIREGAAQSEILLDRAVEILGPIGSSALKSQRAWKAALKARFAGAPLAVASSLRAHGVSRADRALAWTDPLLVRPRSDDDFERLLTWLGIPAGPAISFANQLVSARARATHEIREELEDALSNADLIELEQKGIVHLTLQSDRLKGMMATRVIAISPFEEPIHRNEVRRARTDSEAKWLE